MSSAFWTSIIYYLIFQYQTLFLFEKHDPGVMSHLKWKYSVKIMNFFIGIWLSISHIIQCGIYWNFEIYMDFSKVMQRSVRRAFWAFIVLKQVIFTPYSRYFLTYCSELNTFLYFFIVRITGGLPRCYKLLAIIGKLSKSGKK